MSDDYDSASGFSTDSEYSVDTDYNVIINEINEDYNDSVSIIDDSFVVTNPISVLKYIMHLRSDLIHLDRKCKEYSKKSTFNECEISRQMNITERLTTKFDDLQRQCYIMEDKIIQNDSTISQLKHQLSESEKQVTIIAIEKQNVITDYEKLLSDGAQKDIEFASKNQTFETTIDNLNGEIENLKSIIEKVENANEKSEKRANEAETRIQTLIDNNKDLQVRNAELYMNLQTLIDNNKDLQVRNAELYKDSQSLINNNKDLQVRNAELYTNLQTKFESSENDKHEKILQLQTEIEDIKKLRDELDNKNSELKLANMELQQKSSDLSKTNNVIISLNTNIKHLENELKKNELKNVSLSNEILKLESKIASEQNIDKLKTQIKYFEMLIEEYEKKLIRYEQYVQRKTDEIATLRNAVIFLERQKSSNNDFRYDYKKYK